MQKMKALGATMVILGLTTFPAVLAILQLGLALSKIDRMHHATGLRLHEAQVLRP